MAQKTVSELTTLAKADVGDYVPVVDSSANTTKKVPAEHVMPDGSVTLTKLDVASTITQPKGATGWNVTVSDGGYNDLSTPASVTVAVPASGKVIIIWSARVYGSTSDNTTYVTYAMTGANTIAATDSEAAAAKVPGATIEASIARVRLCTGLNPGTTTFKLQRRNTLGNITITSADIVVLPVFA